MNRPAPCSPSPEEGLSLHLRLCDFDPTATADVYRVYTSFLLDSLAAACPEADEHLRLSAIHDALVAYFKHPQAYDPGRISLAAYLRMAARSDMLNLLEKEKRHHQRRIPWSVVELDEEDRNIRGREGESVHELERAEEAEQWQRLLQSVRENCTEMERQVLELMLRGERSNDVYVEVLDMAGLPKEERDREVKRVKERIKKRLERGGRGHG